MIQGLRGLNHIFVAHFECTLHQAERFSAWEPYSVYKNATLQQNEQDYSTQFDQR